MIAYKQAAKLISGTVLEIGCGEGYGISELAQFSKNILELISLILIFLTNSKRTTILFFIKWKSLHYITLSQIVLIM